MQSSAINSTTVRPFVRAPFASGRPGQSTRVAVPRVAVQASKQDGEQRGPKEYVLNTVAALAAAQLALSPFAGSAIAQGLQVDVNTQALEQGKQAASEAGSKVLNDTPGEGNPLKAIKDNVPGLTGNPIKDAKDAGKKVLDDTPGEGNPLKAIKDNVPGLTGNPIKDAKDAAQKAGSSAQGLGGGAPGSNSSPGNIDTKPVSFNPLSLQGLQTSVGNPLQGAKDAKDKVLNETPGEGNPLKAIKDNVPGLTGNPIKDAKDAAQKAGNPAKGLGGGAPGSNASLGNIDTKPVSFSFGDLQTSVGNPLQGAKDAKDKVLNDTPGEGNPLKAIKDNVPGLTGNPIKDAKDAAQKAGDSAKGLGGGAPGSNASPGNIDTKPVSFRFGDLQTSVGNPLQGAKDAKDRVLNDTPGEGNPLKAIKDNVPGLTGNPIKDAKDAAQKAGNSAKGLGGGAPGSNSSPGNIDTKPVSFSYGNLQTNVGFSLFPRTPGQVGEKVKEAGNAVLNETPSEGNPLKAIKDNVPGLTGNPIKDAKDAGKKAVGGAKGLGGGLGNIDTKPISFNYGDLQTDVGNPLFPRTPANEGPTGSVGSGDNSGSVPQPGGKTSGGGGGIGNPLQGVQDALPGGLGNPLKGAGEGALDKAKGALKGGPSIPGQNSTPGNIDTKPVSFSGFSQAPPLRMVLDSNVDNIGNPGQKNEPNTQSGDAKALALAKGGDAGNPGFKRDDSLENEGAPNVSDNSQEGKGNTQGYEGGSGRF